MLGLARVLAALLALWVLGCDEGGPGADGDGDSDTDGDGDSDTDGDGDGDADGFVPVPCGTDLPTATCGAPPAGDPWAFEPPPATAYPIAGSLIDLSGMNEDVAGETGFVGLSADGRDFVRGDGAPIRFWAVGSSVWESSPDELPEHARFLAAHGVNMVRWHGHVPRHDAGAPLMAIDEDARDRLWSLVAAMREEGIYTTISPYYPVRGVPGFADDAQSLLFVDAGLRAAYLEWLRQLLEPPNPYTGIALRDDPAIAVIQIQNEDSLLFWTVASLSGTFLEELQGQYGAWLVARYGSLEAASAAWAGVSADGDAFAAGRAGFLHIWEMTQPQDEGSGRALRLADQAEFWTTTMRDVFEEIETFLRDEVGARQLVNAGNWKTADPIRLNDLERYAYAANEVIAVNRYYNGGQHLGEHAGWAIVNGDRFEDQSVLLHPRYFPVSLKQPAGAPMLVTESSWVPPLGYQSEGPFLVSAYMALTGVDAFYWFNTGQAGYREPSSANGYLPSLGKWVVNTPELMGNFPAAALMYRMGYVHRGEPAVGERRELDEMWGLRAPVIAESESYDPNRDGEYIAPGSSIQDGVDPLAFLVGPVEVTYDADSATSEAMDLGGYVFEDEAIVCSQTGELRWDHRSGVAELNAAAAQGVTGFLSTRGTFELQDVTIDSCSPYATVLLVSMDGEPLATSSEILLQTGTVARPTGWQVRDASWSDDDGTAHEGFEIVDYGRPPWQVALIDLAIAIRNPTLGEAVVLALDGTPRETLPLVRDGDEVRLEVPPDAKYVVLR